MSKPKHRPHVHTAAVVTVRNAPLMTAKGRHAVALWLRRAAALLDRHGRELSARYTARYYYATRPGHGGRRGPRR